MNESIKRESFEYLERGILSSPVPVTVADIFGNGNNLDETRASRQQLPRRPPRTPRSRRIACPIVPDNPESNGRMINNDTIKTRAETMYSPEIFQ